MTSGLFCYIIVPVNNRKINVELKFMICETQNSSAVKNSNPTTLELDNNNLKFDDAICKELHMDEAGNVYALTNKGCKQIYVTIHQC